MSSIPNYQRRAMEKVITPYTVGPVVLRRGQRFFLDSNEIFLVGISRGEGTCSNLKGVSIAGFSLSQERNSLEAYIGETLNGAVLLRSRRQEETDADIHPQVIRICFAVEGLVPGFIDLIYRRINFRSNQKTKIYPTSFYVT